MTQGDSFQKINSELSQSFAGFIADSFESDSALSTEEDYLFDGSAFNILKEKSWWSRFFSAVGSVTKTYIRGLRACSKKE